MPNIDSIQPVLHDPLDPYHFEFDNLPLQNIIGRQSLLNSSINSNTQDLRDAHGTQGSVSNRLNQSLESDGSLKEDAVNDVMHNIAYHTDGSITISSVVYEYVRMLSSERDKLLLISDEATALKLQVETISNTTLFDDEIVEFENSDTITWTVTAPNRVSANMAFSSSAAHNHYYDYVPVHANLATPNYINYKTTSMSTAFIEGTLRVYINGIRLSETNSVYVPDSIGPSGTWTLTYFTPSYSAGTFALNRAITVNDVIRIDFDQALA